MHFTDHPMPSRLHAYLYLECDTEIPYHFSAVLSQDIVLRNPCTLQKTDPLFGGVLLRMKWLLVTHQGLLLLPC